MSGYKTVAADFTFELTEKRSRFIATIHPVKSEAEATEFIGKKRAEFWDARHNVYAYIIKENNLQRFSDDNEPHGTAGKPVLDVLIGSGITDAVIVVTRYFGGVLLGTGGLVRAYSGAAAGAVAAAEILNFKECSVFSAEVPYSMYDTFVNKLSGLGANILKSNFLTDVNIDFYIERSEADGMIAQLGDVFCGKIAPKFIENKFYPI